MKKVLFVDDERSVGLTMNAAIRSAGYAAEICVSVSDALAVLEDNYNDYFVIVSDERMPGQQGNDLLTIAKKRWPNIVRIMVSATDSISSVDRAINESEVFKYISKPARLNVIKSVLSDAYKLHENNLSTLHRLEDIRTSTLQSCISLFDATLVEPFINTYKSLNLKVNSTLTIQTSALYGEIEENKENALKDLIDESLNSLLLFRAREKEPISNFLSKVLSRLNMHAEVLPGKIPRVSLGSPLEYTDIYSEAAFFTPENMLYCRSVITLILVLLQNHVSIAVYIDNNRVILSLTDVNKS